MSLNVNFENPMGYVIVSRKYDGKTMKYRNNLCFANIRLFAEIHETKKEHQLHMFFMDIDHLKRIIKAEGENAKNFLADKHYYFNSFYKQINTATVRYLNQLGARVSFFYKVPKTKKK